MPHQHLPVTGRGRSTSRRTGGASTPRKVPPAPKVLDAEQCREWQALWSTAVAQASWLPEDEPLVLRLIQLRRRAETEGARWQIEHVRGLEDRLLLSGPRGRQRAGLDVAEPPEPEPDGKPNGTRRMSEEGVQVLVVPFDEGRRPYPELPLARPRSRHRE